MAFRINMVAKVSTFLCRVLLLEEKDEGIWFRHGWFDTTTYATEACSSVHALPSTLTNYFSLLM
eukprot:6488839-Amphidinium_carterae.1